MTSISEDGLLARSDLKVGMKLNTINDQVLVSSKEAVRLIKEAEHKVVIVASNVNGYSGANVCSVNVAITTPLKGRKLGIGGRIKVISITSDGFFADTDLKVGMNVETINSKRVDTSKQAITMLNDMGHMGNCNPQEAEGNATIVASRIVQATHKQSRNMHRYLNTNQRARLMVKHPIKRALPHWLSGKSLLHSECNGIGRWMLSQKAKMLNNSRAFAFVKQ